MSQLYPPTEAAFRPQKDAGPTRRHTTLAWKLEYFRRNYLAGYLFISPWLLGLIIFTLGPFLASLYLSFTKFAIVDAPRWVGLGNYSKLFTDDPYFYKTLFNTFYYVVFHVPGVQFIALILALILAQDLRGIAVYRTVFYLPTVTSGVATAILWQWIFNSKFGIINMVLERIGIQGPGWLTTRQWAMPALIIMSLWGVGSAMIIYLAAIKNVPMVLYEAAEIDGASPWRRFWTITMPLITASTFYNVIIGVIGSFQVFTQAYVITGGGPADATLFYVLYLYNTAFENLQMGYASALAWILFLIILFFTVIQLFLSRRWVYYESAKENEGGI